MQLILPTIYPPYSVLYVDCPWRYENKNTGGNLKRVAEATARGDHRTARRWRTGASGAENKYRTLSLGEIKKIPIPDLCAPNAVLALWATVPLGDDPYSVIRAWGFTFKTAFFWIKTGKLGMGHYFRGNVEPLLFATRGKVSPFRLNRQRNYKELPPLKHSAKPAWFRELVEDSTFDVSGKRLEIFARERVAGWDATGLEVDGFDIRRLGKVLTAGG